jgi:rfaE bifunctional protein kinase chain/domain
MEQRMSRGRLAEIVTQFRQRSILVVGDLMVDEYLMGTAQRISQEGPVMVIEVHSDAFKPGGAANVANNLRALGAKVRIAGAVGDDEMGRLLQEELRTWEIDTAGILTDPSRPTTRKTRVVAQNQQVLRVDREQTHPLSEALAEALLLRVEAALQQADAVLVSDYRKGVISPEVAARLSALATAMGKPLVTNPKPTSAPWLRGATVLSLNHFEAEELSRTLLPEDPDALNQYGVAMRERLEVDTLIITQRENGLDYWRHNGEHAHVPAHKVEVADSAGAGDSTIGAMTLALVSGADTYEAAEIACLAGACVVRKHGVATVTPEELLAEVH